MEVKIEVSYKGNTKASSLSGTNIDNSVLVKMVTGICSALQEQLLSEAQEVNTDVAGCMNWNISWNRI